MKRKTLTILLSAMLACSATAILFACGEGDAKTYSVTYAKSAQNEQGALPTDTAKYEEGQEVTVKGKGDLALDGYTFAGWSDGSKTYQANDKYKMPAKDVTFTATWTAVGPTEYTVTYALDGGSWANPDEAPATTVDAGTEITLPGLYDVNKDGKEISGWKIDSQNYELGATYTVNGNVTITAVWGEQKYPIVYVGGMMGPSEVGGRYVAGTQIDVAALPTDWASETKDFVKWTYSYYNEEEELVTQDYEPGDKFTVPEGGATLKAQWKYVGVYVNFVEIDSFESKPVLYKPDNLETPSAAYLEQFVAAIPTVNVAAPEGTEFHWIYENSYEDEDTGLTHNEYIICDMGEDTVKLLTAAIANGIEEVEVYGEVSKIVSNKVLSSWNTVAESLPIQYGQTVTVTADIKVTGSREFMGAFGYLAKADDAAVNTKLRWDWWFSDAATNGADQTKYEALGVKTAQEVVIAKNGEPVANTVELLISLFPNISNFQIVADYTAANTIVVTVTFSSYTVTLVGEEEVYDYYNYTGTATYTGLDPHAGLAQKYLFGIGGEGATVDNVKFIVDGEIKTIPEPTQHNFVEEVCTICGTVDVEHHTIHRYGENGGFCTVCGNTYQIKVGETTYTAELASAAITNNDTSGAWWDGKTSNLEIGAGDQIAVISWDKTRDANYYDVRLDISGEEGKDANDPWGFGGVFRLGPNVFEGTMTKDEQVVTTGTVPADGTDGASLGSYKGILVKVGNTMILSLQCYRDGALFWSQSVTVDLTNTNLPTGTLYFRVAANPTFCDNFTAATGTFTAAN